MIGTLAHVAIVLHFSVGQNVCMSCYALLMGCSRSTLYRERETLYGCKTEFLTGKEKPRLSSEHGSAGQSSHHQESEASIYAVEWCRRNFHDIGNFHDMW